MSRSSRNSLSRRQLLGAGGAIGAGALLAGLGSSRAGAAGSHSLFGQLLASSPSGTVTFGSNKADEVPKRAFDAMLAALPYPDITIDVNTVDNNTFQENISNYLQQPDDLITWFSGYRMRFFAARGLLGDISDVWEGLDGFSDGYKQASTGDDGNQYLIPSLTYPWAVNYSKSLFDEKGYTVPTTWDELIALADEMQADGITPFGLANDGGWPVMGTFDILNMRINGYQFHVDLMAGNEEWTSDQVKEVFARFTELLPYHQSGANGRTWQEAGQALKAHEVGMYVLGTFVSEQFGDDVDDLDFFAYPALNDEHGTDSIDAPIDGFMMAANPRNEEGAKAVLGFLGSTEAQQIYVEGNPGLVAANSTVDSSVYNELQTKAADLINGTANIAQFLDRDTNPEFASNVITPAFADFLADPGSIDSILRDVEEQKQVIFG